MGRGPVRVDYRCSSGPGSFARSAETMAPYPYWLSLIRMPAIARAKGEPGRACRRK